MDGAIEPTRAERPKRLPTVLTRQQALAAIERLSDPYQLITKLLYGSGLRPTECLRLRVNDLDFAQRVIIVRDGNGELDRVTMLPRSLITPLQELLPRVRRLHEKDLDRGHGAVYLPCALERKCPNASQVWMRM